MDISAASLPIRRSHMGVALTFTASAVMVGFLGGLLHTEQSLRLDTPLLLAILAGAMFGCLARWNAFLGVGLVAIARWCSRLDGSPSAGKSSSPSQQ